MIKKAIRKRPHPIDMAVLDQLYVEVAGNDDEIMIELIDTFLNDSRRHLSELPHVIDNGNVSTIQISAHSLRSTFATFGAYQLSKVFAEIEDAVRHGNVQNLSEKVMGATRAFADVEAIVRAERERYLVGNGRN